MHPESRGPSALPSGVLFADLLARRVRTDGARPLITWYAADGRRTELSAVSYENWVAKTANQLIDTLGLIPGDPVALPLARRHPGHWMTLVWYGALWQSGMVAELRAVPDRTPALEVVGPELDASGGPAAADRLACSLHPFGLGFDTALPTGTIDWAAEVKTEPDGFLGVPAAAEDLAWVDDDRALDQSALTDVPPSADRVLLVPADPWTAARDGLLAPLLGGGSVVVSEPGADATDLTRWAADERAIR